LLGCIAANHAEFLDQKLNCSQQQHDGKLKQQGGAVIALCPVVHWWIAEKCSVAQKMLLQKQFKVLAVAMQAKRKKQAPLAGGIDGVATT